jgi:hypothetical protein
MRTPVPVSDRIIHLKWPIISSFSFKNIYPKIRQKAKRKTLLKCDFVSKAFYLKYLDLFCFPFSPQRRRERNKINNLGVLCGSNGRSEWAVGIA